MVTLGIPVEQASVGVAADRDADDGDLAVAEHVEAADAVVGLGLADGGEELPPQAAPGLLRGEGGLGLLVGVVGHRRHPVDRGLAQLAHHRLEPACHLGPPGAGRPQLLVLAIAGRAEHEHVALCGGETLLDGIPRLRHLLGFVECGLARHLQRGQPQTASSAGLASAARKARRSRGAGRAVHVALDGVGLGLGHQVGPDLLAPTRGGPQGVGLPLRLCDRSGELVAGGFDLGDLGVDAGQLTGHLVDLGPKVGRVLRGTRSRWQGPATATARAASTAAIIWVALRGLIICVAH